MTRLAGVPVTPELEDYLESLLAPRDAVMTRLERDYESNNVPAVGPFVGALLLLLARTAGARRMLELGTATGYSAAWLLRSSPEARLVTLELDPARADEARRNLADLGLAGRAEVAERDALEYMRGDRGPYDLIFNDLLNSFPSEAVVRECFALSLERLRPGGLLIADNALRRGEVLKPNGQGAKNVVLWNRLVADDRRLDSSLIPLRDGVSVARLRG
ncbi:MAG TPA: O-methyltransferase [Candidatus Dormibacteraeota bacterium]